MNRSPSALFFFSVLEISSRTPVSLFRLRRMWPRVPWRVACELVSLIGSHTMPGQNSQPTPTSLGRMCLCVLGLTCHLHLWLN